MTAPVGVRDGVRADLSFVLDLGRRVGSTSASSLRAAPPEAVFEAFRALTDFVWTRDHDTLIAELDGRPVGFLLALYDLPDEISLQPQAFVAYMAVEPSAQRRGAGRSMLAELERRARLRGVPHVSLAVTEENAAARALYARAGFRTERRMMTKAV